MSRKAIWIGVIVGSTIGGCVPSLWHASVLSVSGVVFSTIGGLAGIWAARRWMT
jgi:predicted MFS family arabinose efflux permease